jgi:hypothetical protein
MEIEACEVASSVNQMALWWRPIDLLDEALVCACSPSDTSQSSVRDNMSWDSQIYLNA